MLCSELLKYAAKWGDVETVRRLVSEGRKTDADLGGETPLTWAARSPRAGLDTIRALLELGASPQPALTASYTAAKARVLLEAGASAEFSLGCARPDDDIWPVLLQANANPNHGEALQSAAQEGRADLVRLLLDYGASPDLAGWNDLQLAVWIGDVDDVRRIVSRGTPAQDRNASRMRSADPWIMGLRLGDLEKLQAMVETGANPVRIDIDGETALFAAAQANRPVVMRWLIELGAPVDWPAGYGDATAFRIACEYGATDAVAALIEAGASVVPSKGGHDNPLYSAMNVGVVRLIVSQGGVFNDTVGDTLIARAAKSADDNFACDLIMMMGNVNACGAAGRAMYTAVREDERNIVRMLLEAGSNPNEYYDDWTPLFYARSPEVAQMLLEAGADPTVRDYCTERTTAVDWIGEPEVRAVIEAAL